jgi:hypothetical protein
MINFEVLMIIEKGWNYLRFQLNFLYPYPTLRVLF